MPLYPFTGTHHPLTMDQAVTTPVSSESKSLLTDICLSKRGPCLRKALIPPKPVTQQEFLLLTSYLKLVPRPFTTNSRRK